MKEIGILFQDDMVRAILQNRKTLTSRLRGLESLNGGYYKERINKVECRDGLWCFWEVGHGSSSYPVFTARSPYGGPGDVLIGRECWAPNDVLPLCDRPEGEVIYRADGVWSAKWRSSMVMPWIFTRLRLLVVRVWPSRLQDMTEEMARQEGCETAGNHNWDGWPKTYLIGYSQLWDRINGEPRGDKPGYPWESNPFVWRVEFKRIKP